MSSTPLPDPSEPVSEPVSEFIRGPKWRTRTTPSRRRLAAAFTFAVVVAVGSVTVWGCIWLLRTLDSPGWVATLPWLIPTAGAVIWTVMRPAVSGLTDDDDDSWFGYSVRWALVGELERRPVPVRLITAVLFGAPVVWALLLLGVLTLTGIV